MTVDELNHEVRENVFGPDWMLWKGARYERGSDFATDKVIFVAKDYCDEEVFEWMEELEGTKKHKRMSAEQAASDWDYLVETYAVNQLTPIGCFDLSKDETSILSHVVVLHNQPRDLFILVDAERYRLLLEAVPVAILRGTGPSDPIVATVEEGEARVEVPVGLICPWTDRGGYYMKKIRELAPGVGI